MLLYCLLTQQVSKLTVQHFISHLSKWESLESGFKKNGPWHLACALRHDNATLLQDIAERKKKTDFRLTSWWHLLLPMGYREAALCHSPAPSLGTGRTRERSPALVKACKDPSEDTWHLYQSVICEVCIYYDQKMALICQQTSRNHFDFKYLRNWQQ